MVAIDIRGNIVSAADPPIATNPNPDLAIKAPVRVATTGSNITLAGLQTIDGIALAAGDRVLVKDQTDATTNGLYNPSTGNWTRTIDANNNSQITTGTLVSVYAGTVNIGNTYKLTAAAPVILGTSNLIFALLTIVTTAYATGAVRMFPAPGQGTGAWNVVDPSGNPISTVGTMTQGLQEAITFAVSNGFPLEVFGHGATTISQQNGTLNGTEIITGLNTLALSAAIANGTIYVTSSGIPPATSIASIDSASQIHLNNAATLSGAKTLRFAQNVIFLSCTTGIQVPPAEQWSARFHDVNITFSSTVTGPCFQFDSCMIVNFELNGGQIVGQPNPGGVTSILVSFAPTNPVPLDGIVAITGSRFYISNCAFPASSGSAQAAWGFNLANGSIDNSIFMSVEINGTGIGNNPNTNYGMLVFNPQPTTAFEQNIIDVANIHLTKLAAVQVGLNSTNAFNLRQNVWNIGGIRAAGGGDGFNTFGSFDVARIGAISNEEAAYNRGVVFQSSAAGNLFTVGQILGASISPVVDTLAANSVIGGANAAGATFLSLSGQAGNSTSNVRVAGQITAQLTPAGTPANTNETTLQTFALPANTLDAPGRCLRIRAWGTFGANANGKTVRLYFGVSIYNSTALAQNGTSWILEAEVYKVGLNVQTTWATILAGNSDPGAQVNAPAQTDSAAIVIKITGQNGTANANDIVCNGMSVLMIN